MSDAIADIKEVPEGLRVIEGVELQGTMNTDDETVLRNMAYSCRQGHPQFWPQGKKSDRVVLVGGGPSLKSTEKDLVDLVFEGAKVVTVNGSYHWCLERNIRPSAQIVLDARASNARFLTPEVPNCAYLLASQTDKACWDAVKDYKSVFIWHSVGEKEGARAEFLNKFYMRNWVGVAGGVTVTTRAIGLLRMLGYLRFDLFGVDSCWFGDANHAFPQPENDRDARMIFRASPTGRPDLERLFICSPWHVKQLEDFLQFIRVAGHHFALNIHGDGLIAYALKASAASLEDLKLQQEGVE